MTTKESYQGIVRFFCFLSIVALLALYFVETLYPLRIASILFLTFGILMMMKERACLPILIVPLVLALFEIARSDGEHILGPIIIILLSFALFSLKSSLPEKPKLLLADGLAAAGFSLAFLVCLANITQFEKTIGVTQFSQTTLPMGLAYALLALAIIALAEHKIGNRALPLYGAPLMLTVFIITANLRLWWVFEWSGLLNSTTALGQALENVHFAFLSTAFILSVLFILALFLLGNRRQQSAEFEAVLNATDEAIFSLTKLGNIYYLNNAALRFLSLPEMTVGKPLHHFLHGDELDRRYDEKGAQRFLDVVHLQDGDQCFCEVKIETLPSQEKLIMLRDITERIQNEEHLRNLLRDLNRTNRELIQAKEKEAFHAKKRGEFLETLSHEIRNPLSSMITISNMFETTTLTDEQKHLLKLIKQAEDQLLKLVNDVIDYSKIEEGYLKLQEKSFSLHELLEEIADGFAPLCQQKRLHFSLHLDPNLPLSVVGDSHRLKQILLNFLGNALKFTKEGSISLDASLISKNKEEAIIRLSTTDTGLGVDKEKQELIFNRFTQASDMIERNFGGTGLGLAIAKELTEMMHGTIGVNSTTGRGSTFFVEIPFKISGS